MTNTAENISQLRWGILGAARIAGKALVPAFRALRAEVVAVGASSLERAEEFARAQEIPRAYEGYQAVLDDPAIEAVYLPLSNALHKEWAIKSAQASKHCLCEKPMVLTARDAAEIREAFAQNGRVLQEAFMWRHHPQIAWLRERIADGALGELRTIHAHFSFTLDRPADYRWKPEHGGGAFWDIGCYCVNGTRLLFGDEPMVVSARQHLRFADGAVEGVDESTAGWLDFGDGKLATFSCSFTSAFAAGIELVGTKARAWVSRPWLQAGATPKILIETDAQRSVEEFEQKNGYEAMIENFTQAVRTGSDLSPGEDGYHQAVVMDALLQSAKTGGRPVKIQPQKPDEE